MKRTTRTRPAHSALAPAIAVLSVVGALCGVLTACTKPTPGTATPERLVAAHHAALQANDPAAAYALLSPGAQAKTPYPAFEARWKRDATERAATLTATATRATDARGATRAGTTVHAGGHVLQWTEVGGTYIVVSGLPGLRQAATPAQAIRSFIAAVRRADLSEVRALLTVELATGLDDDWETRANAIERALQEPGALELSGDLERAALRYEPHHAITLQQTPEGWRILSLQ